MRDLHVCEREQDIVDLSRVGAWPRRADADLVAHADACASCRDLVLVLSALGEDDGPSIQAALPDARLVWHRAQMQARRESEARAARPVVLIEIAAAAVVCLVVLLWASELGGLLSRAGAGAGSWITGAAAGFADAWPWRGDPAGTAGALDASETSRPVVAVLAIASAICLAVVAATAGLLRLADRSDDL